MQLKPCISGRVKELLKKKEINRTSHFPRGAGRQRPEMRATFSILKEQSCPSDKSSLRLSVWVSYSCLASGTGYITRIIALSYTKKAAAIRMLYSV